MGSFVFIRTAIPRSNVLGVQEKKAGRVKFAVTVNRTYQKPARKPY